MKIETKVVRISPRMAAELLATADNPRGKHPAGRIQAYARVMREGRWKLSSPILIDEHGKLLDGFGRLTAVTLAHRDVDMLMLSGVPRESADAIDAGKSRNPAVALRDHGLGDTSRIRALIAGLVRLPTFSGRQILNCDYVPLYELYQEAIDAVLAVKCASNHKAGAPTTDVLTGFVRAIISRPDKRDDLAAALQRVVTLDFRVGDESLRLLARAMRSWGSSNAGSVHRADRYLKTANALSAFLNGRKIQMLKAAEIDPFPIDVPL